MRDRQGQPAYMHNDQAAYKNMCTACLTTGWYDHVKAAMTKHIRENGLKYIKIDLAMLTGAYRFDKENFGCFAKNHPHKDREESLLMIYRRAWQLFDELHEAFPDLYIDLSFEAAGDWQLMDLDQCKHTHGNWLFNCYDAPPAGCLRQRNVAWWVSPAIPAPAVLLGCMKMDNPQIDFMVGSLTGTVPLMLGDPRKLSAEQRARYRQVVEVARRGAAEARLRHVPPGSARFRRTARRRVGRLAADQYRDPFRRIGGRFSPRIAREQTDRSRRTVGSRLASISSAAGRTPRRSPN